MARSELPPVYYTSLLALSDDALRERLSAEAERVATVYAAAVGGSPAAQVSYGQMLLDGDVVDRDRPAARRWFEIAAAANDADGINMLGRCYELGWGVASDPARARVFFQKAAAANHPWAQFNLATLMLRSDPTPGEIATALTLLVRAARQGNAKAMNMIGRYREFGWAGPANIPSAIRWYRRAAEGGCFRGAAHLARFLLAASRREEAISWFGRSVAAAPADFCRDLAAQLCEADCPDLQAVGRAALKRAAERGEASDLFAYGHALATGRGGPVDRAGARVWLFRAEADGVPGALAVLDGGGGTQGE